MSLKLEFAERATRAGAKVAPLCREFGISRETGHKWMRRYREQGADGLEELSRRPHTAPLSTAEDIVLEVLHLRARHSSWGAKKLVILLAKRFGPSAPSVSTVERILRQFGRIERKRARSKVVSVVEQAPDITAETSNDVWSVDFKGWWRTQDRARCEPLTIRDAFSRMILATKILSSTSGQLVRQEFERLFRKYGIPKAIRCDNGAPFISVQSRAGLTKLSAWWTTLGIRIIRSRPACPQDNGAHERMHRDMRHDVQRRPRLDMATQQRACDRWRQEFNRIRPHEALGGKTPAEVYRPATRRTLHIAPHPYPIEWRQRRVKRTGYVRFEKEDYFVGAAFAGLDVAFEHLGGVHHRLWLCDVDLGKFELAPPLSTIELAAHNMQSRTPKALRKARPSSNQDDEKKRTA